MWSIATHWWRYQELYDIQYWLARRGCNKPLSENMFEKRLRRTRVNVVFGHQIHLKDGKFFDFFTGCKYSKGQPKFQMSNPLYLAIWMRRELNSSLRVYLPSLLICCLCQSAEGFLIGILHDFVVSTPSVMDSDRLNLNKMLSESIIKTQFRLKSCKG